MVSIRQATFDRNNAVRKFCREGQAGELRARRPGRVFPHVSRQKDTAMSTDYLPRITTRDLSILEEMLDRGTDGNALLATAIRRKLRLAQITFADDLPANVVTLGSRLAFQVDDRPIEERTLVTTEQYVHGQGHQSIASLRGVAMLGLAEGNCLDVELDGRAETLGIIQVLYQPEASRRARGDRAGLRLVSNRTGTSRPAPRPDPHGDDPGPSAA